MVRIIRTAELGRVLRSDYSMREVDGHVFDRDLAPRDSVLLPEPPTDMNLGDDCMEDVEL